jgi:hypothetical protein
MAAIFALPCAATEAVNEIPTEAISEAVSESSAASEGTSEKVETTEIVTDVITGATVNVETETGGSEVTEPEISIDIGEVHQIIESSSSFAEAVIAIADRFGVSVEDAEKLVNDMKALGDKYLGESEIWVIIKNDMESNPGKYVVVAMVVLIIVAIVAFMLKWIISNIGQMRTMKMDVASLKRSVDGDGGDGDDDGDDDKAKSLRTLICAKNDEIKALEEKEAALEAAVQQLIGETEKVLSETSKVTKNTEIALGITQETALQIAQLLSIALDKGKMPVVSKEARKIWYDNFQSRVKAATVEGGDSDAEASKKVPKV